MKKILLFLLLLLGLFIPFSFAFADGLDISFTKIGDNYRLDFNENGNDLSFEEAKKKYDVDDYLSLPIDGVDYYFYRGNEISKDEYDSGIIIQSKKGICNEAGITCLDINDSDELLSKIKSIYEKRDISEFHFFYSKKVYDKINFEEIDNFFKDNYLMSPNKNYYKYNEYGIILPIKFMPYHDENEMIVNTNTFKMTLNEEKILNKFLDEFLKVFDGKSDYEKILGVYSYITKTSKYVEDENGYKSFVDGYISAYDVLLTHKTVCIGSSTTFQLLMEKLGIESYIVDHVIDYNENSYSTTHTYNVVKLEDKWFIVDINASSSNDETTKIEDSLLVTMGSKYDINDFNYLGITISDKSYYELYADANKVFKMDYDNYIKLADDLVNKQKEDENVTSVDENNNMLTGVIITILGIILVISVIILKVVKRK